MKRTLLLASSAAIIGLVLAAPVWARGFGGGGYGGGRGGYGGGGRGGYGGGGYHGGEMGGRGGYGGYHGGEEGHGNYSDGFHGGEEGYHGGYGGNGQHPGSFGGQSPTAGNFGSQAAGHNLSNVNPSNLSNLQGAGKNLNPNNLNPSNFNGSHLQQQQPWNNWYQGHGNWGNTNTAGNWAGSGLGAAAGLGAADLGAAAAAVPGWGMGSAYYDSGYGSYSNPYYSGDDGSSGYDYSQPVQAVQYSAPSQAPQGDGSAPNGPQGPGANGPAAGGPGANGPAAGGPGGNWPTPSDEALRLAQRARLAFRDEDYTGALNASTSALKQMPGDPALHEFRAQTLFALGHYQKAAAAVYSILAVGPGWNWTTMIGLYGDDTKTYTQQLRALEANVTANPDSSADHFLLAYQYLCCNETDAAAGQLKKVIELTPKDPLAPQLLATITKPKNAAAPSAPATSTEKPLTASALVGDWTSRRDDGSTIELKVTNDSKFTWIYTANGKTQTLSGTAGDVNGLLALQQTNGNALMAHVTAIDGGGFRLRLVGGPANDPGLIFSH